MHVRGLVDFLRPRRWVVLVLPSVPFWLRVVGAVPSGGPTLFFCYCWLNQHRLSGMGSFCSFCAVISLLLFSGFTGSLWPRTILGVIPPRAKRLIAIVISFCVHAFVPPATFLDSFSNGSLLPRRFSRCFFHNRVLHHAHLTLFCLPPD